MDFQNATGRQELEYMSRSIPAVMTTDLSSTGLINIVERMQIDRIMREHSLSISGAVDERTAKEAGKLLGADYMLTGSFTRFGSELRIDVRLIDTKSGTTTSFGQTGRDENVLHKLSESLTRYLTGKETNLIVKSPRPLYTEDTIVSDKPWYEKWWVWVIVGGIVAGVVISSQSRQEQRTTVTTTVSQ